MTNTEVREKLVELLIKIDGDCPKECHCYECEYDKKAYCHTYGQADYLIANGVTFADCLEEKQATSDAKTSDWISVKERLPEAIDSYIVVVEYKYDFENEYDRDTDIAMFNPYENGYIDGCWNTYNDWDEGHHHIHVTHWMPLPEPPKEE